MKSTPRYIRKVDGSTQLIASATSMDLVEGVDLFINLNKDIGLWTLSEGRTGLSVGYGSTKKRCLEMFKQRLEHIGVDKFKELIEKAVADKGEVPKYNA